MSDLHELTQSIKNGEITPHEIRQSEDGGLDIFLNIHVQPSLSVCKTMENLNRRNGKVSRARSK